MPFQPLPLADEPKDTGFKPLPLNESGFQPLPIKNPAKRYEQEEPPYMAQHPNLYAAKESAKDLAKDIVPYVKYFDPQERADFMKLDKQHQVRALLKENLFSQLFLLPGTRGAKYGMEKAGVWFTKNFPRTYKVLTKPRMLTQLQKEERAIDLASQTPVVQKLNKILKEAKPIRAEQEKMYTATRAYRASEAEKVTTEGMAGYFETIGKLKGKMPTAQFEPILKKMGQVDTDLLFTQLKHSQKLNFWEKLTAGRGLAKIFGEFGGHVPQEKELEFLAKEFGTTFTKTLLSKQSLFTQMKNAGYQIANIPRSVMASFDFSAPLRQGLFLIGRPKRFASATKSMFKPFFSEKAYGELIGEITSRPTYALMEDSGLSITGLSKGLTNREEVFMSNWAEKIPLVGRGVRASERAYVGFLNRLRADVFDDFVKKGARLGIDSKKYFESAAKFVNTATGRGSLDFGIANLESAAVPLNTFFFSPRLVASRLQLLNPIFYAGLEANVRKEALKDLFVFGSTALGVAGLMKYGGADIGFDPRNSDFMKAKFGNTRYDFLGGFQQPVRLSAQLISGKIVSSTTGKTMTLGEGYRSLTTTEIISRFLEYKQAPIISFATGLIRGTTALGEKFDIPTEIANRFVPMVVRDIQDLYKERGFEGIPMAFPAIFGVGVQTYGGVQSFGLNGTDYPRLNKELLRLKTSMGYPSAMAFGESLSVKEYKKLKKATGTRIANYLNGLINTPSYKQKDDVKKLRMVEHKIDIIKKRVKHEMFPRKERKHNIKSHLMKSRNIDEEEADRQAEEILKRRNR